MKFDRHIGSTAAEVPVKFQSDRTILDTNLAASRLYEILRKDVFSDIETGPRVFLIQHCLTHYINWLSLFSQSNANHRITHWASISYYSDVIMSTMAYQITIRTLVYSTVYSGAEQRKHQSSASLAFVRGINSQVTGEFPAQMASNAENVSIWWRHHEYIMGYFTLSKPKPRYLPKNTETMLILIQYIPGIRHTVLFCSYWLPVGFTCTIQRHLDDTDSYDCASVSVGNSKHMGKCFAWMRNNR